MAIKGQKYHLIEVESCLAKSASELHGKGHIRPVPGQAEFDTSLHVACPEELKKEFGYALLCQ